MKPRDSQRSRCYAWERRFFGRRQWTQTMSIEECDRFLRGIWGSERGRVGLAKREAPQVRTGRGGGLASHSGRWLSLGVNARNEVVLLHEMAHCLTPRDEAHGPRFVGVLIGLYARHAGADATELMAMADEMGVKYHVRSIGVVPVTQLHAKLERLLPVRYMTAAVELDVSYLQVYGAALTLIRRGVARWKGKTLVRVEPKPEAA